MSHDIGKILNPMADVFKNLETLQASYVPNPSDLAKQLRVNITPPIPQVRLATQNHAEWMYERLCRSINDFESELDEEHEIGARLVSFGQVCTFHIEDLGYWEPDMILFFGINDMGENVQLLQHYSQLSVLLVAVQKREEKARRIGFDLVSKLETASEDDKD